MRFIDGTELQLTNKIKLSHSQENQLEIHWLHLHLKWSYMVSPGLLKVFCTADALLYIKRVKEYLCSNQFYTFFCPSPEHKYVPGFHSAASSTSEGMK